MELKDLVSKIKYILNPKSIKQLVSLGILIIIGAFLELIGVSAILPLISLISSEDSINSNAFIYFLSKTFNFQTNRQLILMMVILLIVIYILKNLYLSYLYSKQYKFVYTLQKNVACELLDNYLHREYTFFLNTNSAELLRTINTDVSQFTQTILNVLLLITDSLVVVSLSIYLMITDIITSAIVVILLLLSILVLQISLKRTTKTIGIRNQTTMAKMIQWLNQSFGGIKTTKLARHEAFFVNKYRFFYDIFANGMQKYLIFNQIPRYIIETVIVVGVLVVILVKMLLNQDLQHFLPQLSVFAVAAFRLLPAANRINGYFNTINFYYPSIEVIYNNLNCGKQIHIPLNEYIATDTKGDIELRDITFQYPNAEKPILNHIDMTLRLNKATAFVGQSGAGKTTLADIILGLLQPDFGEIKVNGVIIKNYPLFCSKNMGYIPQTIYLSDDTIRNNIAFGIEEYLIEDEKIWKALESAQLDDFVKGLPQGLDTIVGESGTRLSGGQRQRIGIARALYQDPSIIILDEATSSLDMETEKAVMDAIEKLKDEKTLLIIAHRITTIKNCDYVYEVKDNGVFLKNS